VINHLAFLLAGCWLNSGFSMEKDNGCQFLDVSIYFFWLDL